MIIWLHLLVVALSKECIPLTSDYKETFFSLGVQNAETVSETICTQNSQFYISLLSDRPTCVGFGAEEDSCDNEQFVCAEGETYGSIESQIMALQDALQETDLISPDCPDPVCLTLVCENGSCEDSRCVCEDGYKWNGATCEETVTPDDPEISYSEIGKGTCADSTKVPPPSYTCSECSLDLHSCADICEQDDGCIGFSHGETICRIFTGPDYDFGDLNTDILAGDWTTDDCINCGAAIKTSLRDDLSVRCIQKGVVAPPKEEEESSHGLFFYILLIGSLIFVVFGGYLFYNHFISSHYSLPMFKKFSSKKSDHYQQLMTTNFDAADADEEGVNPFAFESSFAQKESISTYETQNFSDDSDGSYEPVDLEL